MAYRKPNDLDGFIQLMSKADMRVKGLLAEDLVTFLSDDTNSIACMDMGLLVDGLMPWLTGSHFKIAQKSLEAFTELIKRLGPDFNAYTATVLPHVIDRLGDNKDTVREKAQLLLQTLMEHKVLMPQNLLDKLANNCFKHKNAKVREEFLQTIVNTLNEYGTIQLSVRNYIQPICVLLGDPTVSVRDSAIQTLIEIYKHVGDRLRPDLRRMEDLPASKLAILEQKFDQVKRDGLLFKSAQINNHAGYNNHDDVDNAKPTKIVKRTVSAAARNKNNIISENATTESGAITMETFESSFELVPQLTVFHPKDLDDIYKNILIIISDKNADWEKRIDALKKIRSLLLLNFQSQPQFLSVYLKELSIAFLDILKEELRSQVIREACITIAFMSKTLTQKLDKFCEYILEHLISLIQNSAKVVASASTIALKYIIKYTHDPKLIKIISDVLLFSKSKDIRATLCEIIYLLCEDWPTKALERNALLIRDILKKSLSDADSEARRHSRRAFWIFRRHFPDIAEQIFNSLDSAAQRALERENEVEEVEERRATVFTSRIARASGGVRKPSASVRSVSAVDTAAAQRAKARAQYSYLGRKKVVSPISVVERNSATTTTNNTTNNTLTRGRNGAGQQQVCSQPKTRGRAGVSQSQPGSRSTSPSSKLREPHALSSYRMTGTIPKKSSGIPRSLVSSRETSPTRIGGGRSDAGGGGGLLMKRSFYGTGISRRTPERNQPTRTLATARILQQSRDAENTLADTPSPEGNGGGADYISINDYARERGGNGYTTNMRIGKKLLSREESDDSEASSVCSERSFDSSYTRGNNSNYSLSSSRNRLDWSWSRAPFEDIDTIIQYCASTHWSERKDGLISLTQYLIEGKELTPHQLQCVLDTFRKMFMDTHTKVYSLFLEAVIELILAYANDLHDWLFILLTRLFNKLGTELLNSMHGKIWKTLKVVYEYFPTDLQMKDVFRILSDTAQTPCMKTRIAILKFLSSLANNYCKNTDFPVAEDGSVLPSSEKAVLKIVQMAGDQKSIELRNQARQCLIALYNLNTPHMTKLLSILPKSYQDTAKSCIQSHLRRTSTSGTNSPSSPLSSSSPKAMHSPNISGPFSSLQSQFTSPRSRKSSVTMDGMGDYSEVDVMQNIQKTTEEIRNCFGTSDMSNHYNTHAHTNHGTWHNGHPNENPEFSASPNSKTSNTTTESNTPDSATIRLDRNLLEQHQHQNKEATSKMKMEISSITMGSITHKINENGEIVLDNGLSESEIIKAALTLSPEMNPQQIQAAFINLDMCIKYGNCELPNKHFRHIMKMLLNMLDAKANEVVIQALHVLSRILQRSQMKPNWINFLELILLKIINCCSRNKETIRELETLMPRIVPALPLHLTVKILNPVIATGSYPMNLCALKLLTELVERHGIELTEQQLDDIFPHLARLTDDFQSTVRKAAVFCIVKLYIVMGEDMVKPKLTMLSPSKVRLLNVYIEKQRSTMAATGAATTALATVNTAISAAAAAATTTTTSINVTENLSTTATVTTSAAAAATT